MFKSEPQKLPYNGRVWCILGGCDDLIFPYIHIFQRFRNLMNKLSQQVAPRFQLSHKLKAKFSKQSWKCFPYKPAAYLRSQRCCLDALFLLEMFGQPGAIICKCYLLIYWLHCLECPFLRQPSLKVVAHDQAPGDVCTFSQGRSLSNTSALFGPLLGNLLFAVSSWKGVGRKELLPWLMAV